MTDPTQRKPTDGLVIVSGMYAISFFLPTLIGSWSLGLQALLFSWLLLKSIGLSVAFLTLSNPLMIATLLGVRGRCAWAVPSGILAVGSMACWGILALAPRGEMLGPTKLPGPGYLLWLASGIGALVLAIRRAPGKKPVAIRVMNGLAALLAISLLFCGGILPFSGSDFAASGPEIFSRTVLRSQEPIVTALPEGERKPAYLVFEHLGGADISRDDAKTCAEVARQFRESPGVPQPERSRIAIRQLKAVADKYGPFESLPPETYLFDNIQQIAILGNLDSDEWDEAKALFEWISANRTLLKQADLDLCVQAVQQFHEDEVTPVHERARKVVARLKAITGPYRKVKKE